MAHSILVVDDDRILIDTTAKFLQMMKYDVKKAMDADEALKIIKTFDPDIILTDIMMQGMDGLTLTRIVKQNYSTDVIVMTGYIAEYSYKEAVDAGASDFIFKPFKFEELNLRIKRVLREKELKQEKARILLEMEKLAITDALTALYNSRHFFTTLNMEIDRHNRYNHTLSLLILDIDCFKQYNDTWGHLEGDNILMYMGKAIKSCLRNTDIAFRYGGDEFAVILPETSLQHAGMVGNRIKEKIASKVFTPEKGENITITISMGATDHKKNEKAKSFIQRADKALYSSKKAGRDRLTSVSAE